MQLSSGPQFSGKPEQNTEQTEEKKKTKHPHEYLVQKNYLLLEQLIQIHEYRFSIWVEIQKTNKPKPKQNKTKNNNRTQKMWWRVKPGAWDCETMVTMVTGEQLNWERSELPEEVLWVRAVGWALPFSSTRALKCLHQLSQDPSARQRRWQINAERNAEIHTFTGSH